MTVETNANFISDLNKAYPRNRDLIKEGDDHIRLVKAVLQTTFPGMDAAVNASSEKLNKLDSTFTYEEDTLKINTNMSVTEGRTVKFGGAKLEKVGDPKDPEDAVNLRSLQGSMMWPVGSIFMTVDARNPDVILGFGTWEKFAQGRVIIGTGTTADTNNVSKTFANEAKGGEYEHTLVPEEIAAHKHALGEVTTTEAGAHTHPVEQNRKSVTGFTPNGGHGSTGGGGRNDGDGTIYTVSAGAHTHKLEGDVAEFGGDKPHNNIQPYIACNIWVRKPDAPKP